MPPQQETFVRDCVLYLRKSKGKAGIARQRKEAQAHAMRIRWRIVAEFVEPNTTAFAKIGEEDAPRPEYEAMVQFLQRDNRAPALGVLAWHTDRLSRNTGEVRPFTVVCVKGEHPVETVRCGGYDLSLPLHRKRFRDDVSDAEGEVDHMVERIDSAKAEAAAEGRWLGGKRPFGFAGDGVTHEPVEAAAIAKACMAVLAGSSMRSLAREWNAAGLTTPRLKTVGGNPWTPIEVRRVLLRPRNAGLMVWRGEIVGRASWEPVVDEATWRAVVRVLKDPSRRLTPGPARRWLGSGLYLCGVCELPRMVAHSSKSRSGSTSRNRAVYRCPEAGHASRDAVLLDAYVVEHVVARLSRPDARELLVDQERTDIAELEARLLGLREELKGWRDDAAAGEVTRIAFKPVEKRLLAEIEEVESGLIRPDRALILKDLIEADDPGEEWERTPLDRKRAVVASLCVVTVHRAPRGRPKGWRPGESYFDDASVDVEPV